VRAGVLLLLEDSSLLRARKKHLRLCFFLATSARGAILVLYLARSKTMSQITYAILEHTAGRDRVFADGFATRESAEQAAEAADVIWYRGYHVAEMHAAGCQCAKCTQDPWERQLAAMAA
jgi:hypothetical protein